MATLGELLKKGLLDDDKVITMKEVLAAEARSKGKYSLIKLDSGIYCLSHAQLAKADENDTFTISSNGKWLNPKSLSKELDTSWD